jgi:hypothetical protein
MKTAVQIESFVKTAMAGQSGGFLPCAFFDDSLDCIRVIARDCSVTEVRVNGLITILEATYPKGRKCVGFTLKGATHFCKTYGLDLSLPVKTSDLLDAILRASPEFLVEMFVDHVARPLVREEGIENVEPRIAPDGMPAPQLA